MTTQRHDFSETLSQAGAVTIEQVAPVARFSLRVPADAADALAPALGLSLPGAIGARSGDGRREALRLGPDEWVLTAPEADRDTIAEAMAAAYPTQPHSLVDISDREVTLRIAGPGTLDLLAIGCPRDLDRVEVGAGVRTLFDTAQVVLWRDAGDVVRLDVWRSFAGHVRALLEAGVAEARAGI